MTITYQDSKRISSLSTDTKPTRALPLTGCKAYYNFEQTSGNLTNIATTTNLFPDGLGSSVDATPYNGVVQNATGKVGSYAWTFDGTNDYVDAGTTSSFSFMNNPNQQSTVAFWTKSSAYPSATIEIIVETVSYSESSRGFEIGRYGSSGAGIVCLTEGASNKALNDVITNTGLFPADGTWNHYVFIFDNFSNNLKIYKNNSLFQTIIYSSWTPTTNTATHYPLTFGRAVAYGKYFTGSLDEFSIWNRILSAGEMSTLYNSGSGLALNTQTAPETNSIAVLTNTGARGWFDGNNWIGSPITIDYLVIAGGGGGNDSNGGGGGGGGGGLRSSVASTGGGGTTETSLSLTKLSNYTVTVGAGGTGGTQQTNPKGNNSVFSTITSIAGGGGASDSGFTTGAQNGGCGGGGAYAIAAGTGTTNQGYAGGAGYSSAPAYGGGGGGGTASVGTAGSSTAAGNGGNGASNNITGSSVNYGGGGGGGRYDSGSGGTGGSGGGGNGGSQSVNSVAGTVNTGGGGGGEGYAVSGVGGSNGGSGVVILRWLTANGTIVIGSGLTGSTSTSGSYTIATITAGTGNVSWA